jgi:uncharacterized protein (UPF0262 family)
MDDTTQRAQQRAVRLFDLIEEQILATANWEESNTMIAALLGLIASAIGQAAAAPGITDETTHALWKNLHTSIDIGFRVGFDKGTAKKGGE